MSKKNKILIGSLSLLLVCTIVIGVSYARWAMTNTQTTINKLTSSCFSMELTNEKDSINLSTTYPITDNEGKKLTPYQFTITNTCDLFASYTINLEMLEGTTLNSKYIKTMINSEAITNLGSLETTTPTISGATESRVLFKGSLGAGDSVDYTFRLWMDYDTPLSSDTVSKVFNSKITITSEPSTYSPVENGFTNLAEALLVNEYQTTSVDVAKNKIASKQDVDTTKTAPIIDWQEKVATSITSYTDNMVHPDMIGSFNVTEKMTKINIGTGYTFNKETGYFNLTGIMNVDPTTLDYSEKTYYAIPNYGTTKNNNNNTLNTYTVTSGVSMYKLSSATKLYSTGSFNDGTSFKIIKYTINGYKYTQLESESDKSDKGLYEAQDDHGTSYYYRGSVSNNYVKFGGYYWRIIRINGDGSIRLLYAGTNSTSTGNELFIGTNAFNISRNNPAYIGYMYGSTLDTSLAQTNASDVDSTIKVDVDNWYKTNILDKGLASYIADSGFCGDRSITNGNGYLSTSTTNYGGGERYSTTKTPILSCPTETDLYTTKNATYGNKSLNYPIGLITSDELMFGGLASGYINPMSYTYSSANYWTMTPNYYSAATAYGTIFVAEATGYIKGSIHVSSGLGIRPVINLKADTEISSGIGTKNDPFIVK